jgi:putative copper export protein/mono/diheme cytochrome c family protein
VPDLLGCVRGLQVAASLSLFGALLFRVAIVPAVLDRAPSDGRPVLDRRIKHVAIGSVAGALVIAPAWLLLQAGTMVGGGLSEGAAALGVVLRQSHFGAVFLLRIALLLLAAICLAFRGTGLRSLALIASGGSVAVEGALGHAAGMDGAERMAMTAVQGAHLLAAGAWLGGLLPLWLTLSLPAPASHLAVRRFSPLGLACVAVLALTAVANFCIFIGGLPELLGTSYGQWTLAKTGLFATLLGLAAANRFRFAPRLSGAAADGARPLRVSVAIEAMLGLAIVLAAGMLSISPPGRHEQPWWPFPLRLSGEALQVPALAVEILVAGLATLAGLLLLLATLRLRRLKGLPLVAGLGLIAYAAPSWRLLTVEAFPTTFWRSPTGFSAASIARGTPLFATHCATCHGPDGRGDGAAAPGGQSAPTDLTADHIWDHPDGDLFCREARHRARRHAVRDPPQLDETARWNLIDFVHANAAGATVSGGTWQRPMMAPELDAACPEGRAISLHDLAGRVVHLVFAVAPAERSRELRDIAPRLAAAGTTTVFATPDPSSVTGGFCVTDVPEVRQAYALISGLPVDAMATAEFLIDGGGWLRALCSPVDQPGWSNVDILLRRIEAIRRTPLAAPGLHMHAH